eukprot:SAG11_NODE_37756_length_255_cov_0.980769_1_plen_27_part_01
MQARFRSGESYDCGLHGSSRFSIAAAK